MDADKNFSANPADYTELSSIGLTRGKVGRVENGRGVRVRVETGAVWLTQERGGDDVVLRAGQSYRIEEDGMTLLANLGGKFALVTVEPSIPAAPTMGKKFWAFWASLYAPESCPTTAAL
jgi:hypothetical protein